MKIIRQLGFGIFGFGGDSEPNNKKIRVHSERIEEKHQENRGFESGEKRKEFFREVFVLSSHHYPVILGVRYSQPTAVANPC
jgi:hypothetical protein